MCVRFRPVVLDSRKSAKYGRVVCARKKGQRGSTARGKEQWIPSEYMVKGFQGMRTREIRVRVYDAYDREAASSTAR